MLHHQPGTAQADGPGIFQRYAQTAGHQVVSLEQAEFDPLAADHLRLAQCADHQAPLV